MLFTSSNLHIHCILWLMSALFNLKNNFKKPLHMWSLPVFSILIWSLGHSPWGNKPLFFQLTCERQVRNSTMTGYAYSKCTLHIRIKESPNILKKKKRIINLPKVSIFHLQIEMLHIFWENNKQTHWGWYLYYLYWRKGQQLCYIP